MMTEDANHSRSFSEITYEIKEELSQLVRTRFDIFKQELHDKVNGVKLVIPLAGVSMLLLGTAYLLITLALVAAISAIFASHPYRWIFGFLAIGFAWTLLGAVAAYFAKRELELKTLAPTRTLEILKGDKVWLQREVKRRA